MSFAKDHSFWNITPGKGNCGKVHNFWEAIQANKPNDLPLEFTLSLRKDDKEFLEKTYKKCLIAIDKLYSIQDHIAYFELGGLLNHRHIHAKIIIRLPNQKGNIPGLIQELSRVICRIIRRKYEEKNFYYHLEKYFSVPFVLQTNTRAEWDEYIKKQNFERVQF